MASRPGNEMPAVTVTCPTCSASLTIPDERLPRGRVATAACPQCKGRIVIDTTGLAPAREVAASSSATSAPPSVTPGEYADQAQPLALVCVGAAAEREQVVSLLNRKGYAVQVATDATGTIERLRFAAPALVILHDGFGSSAGDGNPVLDYLAAMGMASRRNIHVIFVSPSVRSHDSVTAFARSVNLVLHVNDLPHLAEAVKRSRAETEHAYRIFLDSLGAMGKG